MGSKKKYHTQTQAINHYWDINNTLKGCVYQNLINPGSDLTTIFKTTAEDSMCGKLNNIAKDCQEGGRYSHVLGTPEGSLITKPLTKEIFQEGSGLEVHKIVSSTIISPCESFFKKLIYRVLVDEYQYNELSDTFIITDEDDVEHEHALHSVYLDDDDNYIYFTWAYTVTHGGGPSATTQTITVPINSGVQFTDSLDATYLLVGYEGFDDILQFYYWNTSNSNTAFSNWMSSNKVMYYPSFFFRNNKNSIKREDPVYFETCKKVFQRFNMDFEDLVDSFNGEAELNNPTSKDDDYRDSLKNVTDIALTFALDITANDQRVMRYLFEFFKYMYDSAGLNGNSIYYRHKAFNYDIRWSSISYNTKSGRVNSFHRFTTEGYTETTFIEKNIGQSTIKLPVSTSCLRICKQLDKNQYIEIVVKGLEFCSYNNGHGMNRSVPTFKNVAPLTQQEIRDLKDKYNSDESENEDDDSDPNECLVPVLPFIINSRIGGIIGGDILAISMRSVHNTYVKIKKKWYQSSWFLVVRIVIYIIIITIVTIASQGTATAPTLKAIFTLETLFQLLLVLAIKIAFKFICKVCHIEGATKAILETILDMFCIYVLPNLNATTTTTSGAVVQVGSTAVTTTTTVTTTLSTLASSTIVTMANCIVEGKFDLETIANSLGSVAVNGLMTISPLSGAVLDLATNPKFYYAIQTKDWAGAMTCLAGTSIKMMSSKELPKWTQTLNNTNSFSLGNLVNFNNLTSIGSSYAKAKEQEYQSRLSKLNNSSLSLSKLMQASEAKASQLLNNQNSLVLGLLTEQLLTNSDYDFYKNAGKIYFPKHA